MEEMAMVIGIVVIIVICYFMIRKKLVETKRTMKNTFRAIKEVEDYDQIEAEEDAKRMFNRMDAKPKSGGFVKTIIFLIIAVVIVLYFVMK